MDRPVIFSGPMVRALLDGRKTMTRRIPTPTWRKTVPGDRLYVRENFQLLSFGDYAPTKGQPCDVRYAATERLADCDKDVRGYPWRPSIHMPRFASRLTLVVTATKAERLQNISEADARAEGATAKPNLYGTSPGWSMNWEARPDDPGSICLTSARFAFGSFINELHGGRDWNLKPTNLWDQNPEVVALTFAVHKANIDRDTREGE